MSRCSGYFPQKISNFCEICQKILHWYLSIIWWIGTLFVLFYWEIWPKTPLSDRNWFRTVLFIWCIWPPRECCTGLVTIHQIFWGEYLSWADWTRSLCLARRIQSILFCGLPSIPTLPYITQNCLIPIHKIFWGEYLSRQIEPGACVSAVAYSEYYILWIEESLTSFSKSSRLMRMLNFIPILVKKTSRWMHVTQAETEPQIPHRI